MVKLLLSLLPLLLLGVSGSIADLSSTSLVYIAPMASAFMTIPSNPTTGYSWYMVPLMSDKMRVKDPSGEYTPSSSGLNGSGGYQTFEVICSSHCLNGDIEEAVLIYARPWETTPADTKKITLQVTTDPTLA